MRGSRRPRGSRSSGSSDQAAAPASPELNTPSPMDLGEGPSNADPPCPQPGSGTGQQGGVDHPAAVPGPSGQQHVVHEERSKCDSLSPEGVQWNKDDAQQPSPVILHGPLDANASKVAAVAVEHPSKLLGAGQLQDTPRHTPALEEHDEQEPPEPMSSNDPFFMEHDAEQALNAKSVEKLNKMAQFRDVNLNIYFNLRECGMVVMTKSLLSKAMSNGVTCENGPPNPYVDQVIHIYSSLLDDYEKFHRAVAKAVSENIDQILEERSGLNCYFIPVDNKKAVPDIPIEIYYLCRYLNNLFKFEIDHEKSAVKFVLQAILYQLLSNSVTRNLLCMPFRNIFEYLYESDWSFLWSPREPEALLLSPKPQRPARSHEKANSPMRSPKVLSGEGAFKDYVPPAGRSDIKIRRLKFE